MYYSCSGDVLKLCHKGGDGDPRVCVCDTFVKKEKLKDQDPPIFDGLLV